MARVTLRMRRTPKRLKAPQPVQGRAESSEAYWAGSSASGRSPFRVWGPFVAAGPIMAALSGAAVGSAVGGITGALVGLGIPEFEAKRYEGKLKEGNILISIHSEDSKQTDRAEEILKAGNAQDISSATESAVK